jgi:hypothetical protein
METTIKSRMLEFINSLGVSIRSFESNVGLANGYMNTLGNSMGSDKLVRLHQKYPQLSIYWLLFEEGEMLCGEKSTERSIKPTPTPSFQNNGNSCTNNQSNIPVEVLLNTQSHLTESQKQNSELIRIVAHLTQSN